MHQCRKADISYTRARGISRFSKAATHDDGECRLTRLGRDNPARNWCAALFWRSMCVLCQCEALVTWPICARDAEWLFSLFRRSDSFLRLTSVSFRSDDEKSRRFFSRLIVLLSASDCVLVIDNDCRLSLGEGSKLAFLVHLERQISQLGHRSNRV